ncbi:MAG TPA: shikimate dehydrogenase [Methylotenera sp.]|mgnify:FL=1|nr:shikimate dehydrogenase [Methylotenera sp.]HPV32175.1 shikimate dehydrogenase [Methylotenera sp.]
MTDHYAVIGNPISHSKSPNIHTAFGLQTHQDIAYEAKLAPLDGFATLVHALVKQGYRGANVTVPFKLEAYQLCDTLTERARSAGAVNTLTFAENKIKGDNTDGAGLVNDIEQNLHMRFENKHVLLLGAGGAAQGVLLPILSAHPASLTIANRTIEKAHFMVQSVAATHAVCNINVTTFEHLFPPILKQPFDIVINATSAGLTASHLPISDQVFAQRTLAYDMMYGRETPFMVQARAAGAQVADGLGMLVEQAAEAFYVWRGIRPETATVISHLRKPSN